MERRTSTGSLAAQISTAMVQLLSRYTGRGPTKARTTMNTNLVVVAFEETLTTAELNLVGAGQLASVVQMRRVFHDLLRDEAVATVEGSMSRKVRACLSDVDPRANVAAMVFVLEPVEETGRVEVAETSEER